MKKNNVIMILILVILLSIALIGTYAYQVYTQETIENTFIIGDVSVELYEKDQSGNKITNINQEYNLERNTLYEKNMVVNVGANSEDCFVYIVLKNDLAPIEAEKSNHTMENSNVVTYTPVETQIQNNGWSERTTSNSNNIKIYWKEIDADTTIGEIPFMKEFRTHESFDFDSVRKDDETSPVMSFTLYAVEKGTMIEADAWDVLTAQYTILGSY